MLLFVVSVFLASKLSLRTSFAELLPQKLESVQKVNEASDRLGGTGLLVVGVQSPHYGANRKFVEALVKKLDADVGHSIRYYEYRFEDVREYLHKYVLHYLDNQQLKDFNVGLASEIERHKDKALGSFLGLDDDEGQKAGPTKEQAFKFEKLDPTYKKFMGYRDGYLSADDGRIMVISIRPSSHQGINGYRKLRNTIRAYVEELGPTKFDPQMRVEFSGNVQQTLEEFDTIREDLFDTALELAALISSVLFIFVWSLPALLVMALVLIISVFYTFAVTWLGIGYLNTQTAFMASIVVGTGINYAIIYLGRYRELLKHMPFKDALRSGLKDTIAPTLIGSSSTAVAFLTLLISDNKGLSQFGFMGCVGVMFCWVVTYSLLPIFVYEYERRGFRLYPWRNPLAAVATRIGHRVAFGFVRYWKMGLVLMAVVSAVSLVGLLRLAKNPIEYNFDNVRTRLALDADYLGFRKRTNSVFPTSLNPSIVFVKTEAEAREICPTVTAIKNSIPAEQNTIQGCSSLYQIIPKDIPMTTERVQLMKKAQALTQHKLLKYSDYGDMLKAIGERATLTPPTEADIPAQIRRRFKELDGQTGLFAFVSPAADKPLNDGRNLLAFTAALSDFKLPQSGTVVSAAGESFIFADILNGLRKDAWLISTIAFISVIIHCIVFAGGLRNGLFMGFILAIASLWMIGFQGCFDVRYNFFNFIALPLTFGIGIDYPVNVFVPILQEKKKAHYAHIFTSSGVAVLLCSLTTFVGYYTLLHAKSQALASFARISIIGEVACLAGALFMVPVLMQLLKRGQAFADVTKR